jgi:Tfp pilus assembly protein PilO
VYQGVKVEIKTKIKEIIGKITVQFNRLQKRQRTLVLFLAAAILFSFYYNIIFKPQSTALARAKTEWQSINNRLTKLKSQLPDIQKEKESLNGAKRNLETLKTQLSSLELQLPTTGRIPQLLGELVRQAQGYSIDFVSIRPKTSKEKKEYAELIIEMKFNSTYSDFANYLNRLESLSRFLRATDIALEEMKDGFRGESGVTLTLATLLGEAQAPGPGEIKEPAFAAPLSIERNPFLSKFRPAKEGEKKDEFQLSGIISNAKVPTAIINDEVYRVGDIIGNKKVKQILSNMVILTDGRESTVLTLERE